MCCGTGGVGKTTTAAVFAIEAAKRGRNAVVVTIDPAKRLADTLGVDTLGHAVQEIDRRRWDPDGRAARTGRLSAVMLDTETTFDGLVVRYAKDEEQVERILENRFYRNIAGALSGTQEYMAMEKLHELHEDGGYDLIVVDTPPTRHALDFLDAPNRLIRLLDNRIFRLLMMPTRAYLRVAGAAVQTFLRRVTKVVGARGRRRRGRVLPRLRRHGARLPRPRRLGRAAPRGRVDRVRPRHRGPARRRRRSRVLCGPARGERARCRGAGRQPHAAGVRDRYRGAGPAGPRRRAGCRADHGRCEARLRPDAWPAGTTDLADFAAFAARERDELAGVAVRLDTETVAYVAELSHDVHDFDALAEVARHLFAAPAAP